MTIPILKCLHPISSSAAPLSTPDCRIKSCAASPTQIPTTTPFNPIYPVVESTSADPNGTVSFNKKYAYFGETVTVMVSADPYYSAEKIIVRDMFGKEIETTKNADGSYSFKMPAGKVSVEVVYVWKNPFVDVDEGAFYTEAVEWALKNGITNGTGEGKYSPDAVCSRGQMVAFLYRYFAN